MSRSANSSGGEGGVQPRRQHQRPPQQLQRQVVEGERHRVERMADEAAVDQRPRRRRRRRRPAAARSRSRLHVVRGAHRILRRRRPPTAVRRARVTQRNRVPGLLRRFAMPDARPTIPRMRAGPRLMIVGAPKSGSTALFHYLADHPDVRGHVHREMPFFGRDDEFARGWEHAVEKYYPPSVEDAPLVAKHTMAMYDPVAMRRIVEATPAVVVAVLRDPVRGRTRTSTTRGCAAGRTRPPSRRASPGSRAGRQLAAAGPGHAVRRERDLRAARPHAARHRCRRSGCASTSPTTCAAARWRSAPSCSRWPGWPPHEPDVTRGHNEGRAPRSARFARVFLAVQRPGSPLRRLAARCPEPDAVPRAAPGQPAERGPGDLPAHGPRDRCPAARRGSRSPTPRSPSSSGGH